VKKETSAIEVGLEKKAAWEIVTRAILGTVVD
jgi:hypothetical protein